MGKTFDHDSVIAAVVITAVITFLIGIGFGFFLSASDNINPMGFTLVKNESNDWYWLENQEYTQRQLNEYYTLKNILIQNECPDGGLIENLDGKEFLIICYEPTKVIKNIGG